MKNNKILTQNELISEIATSTDVSKIKIKEILDVLAKIVIKSTKEDTSVVLPVLGRFNPKVTKARKCRNPKTGEIMDVQAKKKMTFAPSAIVKDSVN